MKRILGKILGIISVLILGYQQFCYADIISIKPIDEFRPIAFLIGFIGIIVLIITAISFFTLKSTVRKQSEAGYGFGNDDNEKIEKKKNGIQRRFYIWGIILSIVGLIYLGLSNEISGIVFLVPIILFVISFIIRLNKKKKISNIICAISVVLVCLIGAWVGISNKMAENYNNQFLKYEKIGVGAIRHEPRYISEIEGFINTVIKNNKSGRKLTIIYQDTHYKTPEELKQLLSKLNTNKNYLVVKKYDKYYDYIESITISLYTGEYWTQYEK